jgi:regulatory protein
MSETVTITGVHHIPRKSSRRRIDLEDGTSFSMDLGLLTRHGLRVGLVLDEETRAAIVAEDAKTRAKSTAMDLIRVRPRSRHEMLSRLGRKGFDEDAAEYAVQALEDLGYISDEQYASDHIDSRMRGKPKGRYAMRQELRAKGIDRTTIDRALTAVSDEDERDAAIRVATGQLPQYRTLPRDVAHRRMYQFLLRRGFAYEHVSTAMREVMGAAVE